MAVFLFLEEIEKVKLEGFKVIFMNLAVLEILGHFVGIEFEVL